MYLYTYVNMHLVSGVAMPGMHRHALQTWLVVYILLYCIYVVFVKKKKKEKKHTWTPSRDDGRPISCTDVAMWQGNSNSPTSKRPVCALRIRPFEFPNLISLRRGAMEGHVRHRLTCEL